jgi:7,8-dihydroneopterin aldolase/epimerase/oxygenase
MSGPKRGGSVRPLGIVVTPGAGPVRRGKAAQEALDVVAPRVAPSSSALNRIFVSGFTIEAEVGCFRHEHGVTQPLVFDVSCDLDAAMRPRDDDLASVVDYDGVVSAIRAVLAGGHIKLVETVAERLAALLLDDPRVRSCRIRIAKPKAVDGAQAAGVEIVRP